MLDSYTFKLMQTTLSNAFLVETVEIHNVTIALDDFGQSTYTRVLSLSTKGQICDLSGSERRLVEKFLDGGTENTEACKVILPYGTSVTAKQDIKAKGKYWNVAFVKDHQTFNAAVEVLCTRETL